METNGLLLRAASFFVLLVLRVLTSQFLRLRSNALLVSSVSSRLHYLFSAG